MMNLPALKNPRSLTPVELFEIAQESKYTETTAFNTVEAAIGSAMQKSQNILITGSHYTVDEALRELYQKYNIKAKGLDYGLL